MKTLWFYISFGIVLIIAILISTSYGGPAVTFDSLNYLYGGLHKYVRWDGTSISEWPPLYGYFLSCFGSTFSSILQKISFINGLISGLCCILIYYIFIKNTENYTYNSQVFYLALILPLYHIYCMAWSETIFVPITWLWLYLLILDEKKKTSFSRLLIIMVITALACITRYSGIVLIGVIILKYKSSIYKYVLLIPFIPITLWIIIKHHTFFEFVISKQWRLDLIDTLIELAKSVSFSIIPNNYSLLSTILGFGILIPSFYGLYINFRNKKRPTLVYFTGLYTLFIMLIHNDDLNIRFVIPVIPGLYFFFFERIHSLKISINKTIFTILLISFSLVLVVRITYHSYHRYYNGIGASMNSAFWYKRDINQYLLSIPPSLKVDTIYATSPEITAFYYPFKATIIKMPARDNSKSILISSSICSKKNMFVNHISRSKWSNELMKLNNCRLKQISFSKGQIILQHN